MNNKRTTKRTVQKIESRTIIEVASGSIPKRRTGAYARVSTDSEEQLTSYAAQVDYYTQYINAHHDWEFVEVYTDEGITGLNIKQRKGFNRMIEDAINGKVDLIVTKSIARFARNTVDSLSTIRLLKEHNVEVFFEKENLYTFDSKGELLISIISSIAQDESRSISENVAWGWRKRFSDGQFTLPYAQFLGYEKGDDGLPRIVESEASVIRSIYAMYLQGKTILTIAKRLTKSGVPSPSGKLKWHSSVVQSILRNEKYAGAALLQKTFTADYLTKRKKRNEGELPQYYIEHSHPPIVTKEVFELTQERLAEPPITLKEAGEYAYPFSAKLVCGLCGAKYGRRIFNSNNKYRRVAWRCVMRYNKNQLCSNRDLTESVIETKFVETVNRLFAGYGNVATECSQLIRVKGSSTEADRDRQRQITEILAQHPPILTAFDEGIWYALIDHVEVRANRELLFFGRDGTLLI